LLVRIDARYFRPTEVDLLVGDASKAKARLGWTAKTTFEETVAEMAYEDVTSLKVGAVADLRIAMRWARAAPD
jgi:GDPmannose 4,6-dehydratase